MLEALPVQREWNGITSMGYCREISDYGLCIHGKLASVDIEPNL